MRLNYAAFSGEHTGGNMSSKPTLILVTRHAEKPVDPIDPNLSEAGYARAEKLAPYIPEKFGPPDFIFAAAISKNSARPYETVEPLARKIGKPIDATFADQDYSALAQTLFTAPQYADKKVLVCWHHGNIPSLLRMLGCKAGDYPDPWDHTVFNLILQVQFPDASATVEQVEEPF
ncbi:histidine phosphatase family protein [Paraburkholderia fungorum]|uniref:histidine phosphatase family protein n=1 Tax=Paraburkholderia fungorum TaxID=134537 RepID=UPI0038BD3E3D